MLKLLIFCFVWYSVAGRILPNHLPTGAPSSRIVGGINATEGQIPFQCSMQNSAGHFCGCVILSPEWILTAAHCLYTDPESVEILVGTINLNSGGIYYKPKKFIKHEKFNLTETSYDIGLIKLKESLEFNDKVQPIKFSNKFVEDGAVVQASGWGRIYEGSSLPQTLQVIQLQAISNEKCKQVKEIAQYVHDNTLCTFTQPGQGICRGDSGGPLVYNDEVVGLSSWTILCAFGYPDGFTRVSYFHEWIKANMELN